MKIILKHESDDAISPVVSMLLMLTVLVIAVSLASATYLPDLKENAEIIHSSEVKDAFLSFSADVNHQYTSGYVSASSNVFSLGGGDIILSPSKSSGTVKVETVSLGTVAVGGTSYQLNTVNVTYTPHQSIWNSPGYFYEKGVVWVTEDGVKIPALSSLNTESDASSYSNNVTNSWISKPRINGNTAVLDVVSLEADTDAFYASGSQDVVLTIMPKESTTYSGNSLSINGTSYTLPSGVTSVTVNIHKGVVSVR